jgi:hypothetical protein
MKNQQLEIDATAKIVEIKDKDGKPIISNILKIQAELTPTINMEEARKTAEALYEQQGNAFTRFMDTIDPVGKELRLTAAANKQIQSVVENDISATSDAVAQLKQNYLDGAIGLEEYTKQIDYVKNNIDNWIDENQDIFYDNQTNFYNIIKSDKLPPQIFIQKILEKYNKLVETKHNLPLISLLKKKINIS